MTVSLILPCYNPPQGWEINVWKQYQAFSQAINTQVALIIVLDGENEALKDNITYLQQQIPSLRLIAYPENQGKGYAIRQGVLKANNDLIIYTDIDFPYTIASMVDIYNHLAHKNVDVAVGVKDQAYYGQVPYLRKVISRFLRALIRLFLSLPITDTQCGLKGFKKKVSPIFLQTTINRYLFDLEFIRNCFGHKSLNIKAIPIALNEEIQFRKMNTNILLPELFNFTLLLFKPRK